MIRFSNCSPDEDEKCAGNYNRTVPGYFCDCNATEHNVTCGRKAVKQRNKNVDILTQTIQQLFLLPLQDCLLSCFCRYSYHMILIFYINGMCKYQKVEKFIHILKIILLL